MATARLAELQDKLGDSMGRDIFFYSISIDPETDSPERLKEYADAFRAGPGWLFLTGKPEDIHAIRHKLGERSRILSDHRNEILLGNGATGEWARNNVLGDLDSLALTVRGMDPKWRPRQRGAARTDPNTVDFDFAAQPGQALYKKTVRRMPHGRAGRPGRTGSGRHHGTERPRLAGELHLRPREDAGAAGPACAGSGGQVPGRAHARHGHFGTPTRTDLLAYIAHLETQHAKRSRPLRALARTDHA